MSAESDAYKAAEIAIAEALENNETELDLSELTELTRLPPQISELIFLTDLRLGWLGVSTKISDISLLRELIGLQTLDLDDTLVTDFTSLHRLNALQRLSLSSTQISDIAPLQGMSALRRLHLDDTQVTDFAPLRGLTALQSLSLFNTRVTDFAPLQGLTELQTLYLSNTQVTDIAPLQFLTSLQKLYLHNTRVKDITSLQGLTAMQSLDLDGTKVLDLRPILNLSFGVDNGVSTRRFGLRFKNTPAAKTSLELSRLSQIDDDEDRTRATLAYLKTLPPWPEPLPWAIPRDALLDTQPSPPEPDAIPRILLTPDQRIDLDHSRTTEQDISDPIKSRLYARLPNAVQTLVRFGNRYEFLTAPTNALRDLVAVPFEDADLLDIHLEIAALTDVKEADPNKPQAERMDAECMAALDAVLRLGPPVTMGHPDVDLFEKRSLEFSRTHRAATTAEAERIVTSDLATALELTTERLRNASQRLGDSLDDTGRIADYRSSFTLASIIALANIAGALGNAVVGQIAGEIVVAAQQFLYLHMDAIMAVAPSWGESGYKWAEFLMVKLNQIVGNRPNKK